MDKYHILLCDKNPAGINRPCIKIAKNEVLFEKCRMTHEQDKDAIKIQGYDEIKRNRLFCDFMLRIFNHLNQLYVKEKCLLIDTILKYQSRKNSAKENTSKPSPKKDCFADETNRTSQWNNDSYKSNLNEKNMHLMEQVAVKMKMLECVIVGEKVILSIQTKNQMEKLVRRRRLNYLSLVGKVTLRI